MENNILNNINNKRDKENTIEIEDLKNYEFSEEANKILAVLYKNYFATAEERKVIQAKEKILYAKKQEKLREKYNPDNLFKKKK